MRCGQYELAVTALPGPGRGRSLLTNPHRPTGLTNSSSISIVITSQCPPDRVLFGPIDPGEKSSDQLRKLEASPSCENRIEFVLPQELQLRSELRLEWDQLSPESALESLDVELLIREPEDE